jgi:hypothetical protein
VTNKKPQDDKKGVILNFFFVILTLSRSPELMRRGRISSFHLISFLLESSFALLRTTSQGIYPLGMTKKEETLRAKALRVTNKKAQGQGDKKGVILNLLFVILRAR